MQKNWGFIPSTFCGFRFGKAVSQRLSKEVDGGVRARCCLLCPMCSSPCPSGCNSTGTVLLPPRNWTHPQLRQFTLSHKMASDGQPQDRADRPCGCGSSSPNKVRAVPRWVLSRSYVHANGHINDGCARVSCAIRCARGHVYCLSPGFARPVCRGRCRLEAV
jgi:hypothetical protein